MDYDEALKQYGCMIYRYMLEYKVYGYTFDDMINLGRFILWRCCQKYDASKGASFATYFIHAMKKECWNLNRYVNLEKRSQDQYCVGIHMPCSGDSTITYEDVIEDLIKYDETLEVKIKDLLELINKVNEKDRPIIRTFVYTKLFTNKDFTRQDLCNIYGCSIIKVRRIINDFRYLIKKEWGI